MCTLLLDLKQGDEVIIPAYTFTSVANVFANRGIDIKLADSQHDHPNMDPESLSSLIGPRTKAVVFMSYGGQSKGIEKVVEIAKQHKIFVIEDAAHSFNSVQQGKYIGSFGDLGVFSFHETKSVSCGQGGLLMINNPQLTEAAKSIRDHGTNRWELLEGKAGAYNWTSLGGEFNLPELNAALLYGQLQSEALNQVQRKKLWSYYYERLLPLSEGRFKLPFLPDEASNFYIFCLTLPSPQKRDAFISYMKNHCIDVAFHYTGLHQSAFYKSHFERVHLPHADMFSQCLVRLPLYHNLKIQDLHRICLSIEKFYTTVYDSTLV
jgi:dTDP-4-amino-4,6-dideoxygalactose transaminase